MTEPDLRAAFRRVATSTWVVAAMEGEVPRGFTVISVTSVSLHPQLVAFNVTSTAASLAVLRDAGRMSLHLLADDQAPLAVRFAGPRDERFAQGADFWDLAPDGLPRIHGCVARLSLDLESVLEAGDSTIVLARVVDMTLDEHRLPLVHLSRSFVEIASPG